MTDFAETFEQLKVKLSQELNVIKTDLRGSIRSSWA